MSEHQINDAFRKGVIHGKNLILDALIDELFCELEDGCEKTISQRIDRLKYIKENCLVDGERWGNGTR